MKYWIILAFCMQGSLLGMHCWDEDELKYKAPVDMKLSDAGSSTGGLGNLSELHKTLPMVDSSESSETPDLKQSTLAWKNGTLKFLPTPAELVAHFEAQYAELAAVDMDGEGCGQCGGAMRTSRRRKLRGARSTGWRKESPSYPTSTKRYHSRSRSFPSMEHMATIAECAHGDATVSPVKPQVSLVQELEQLKLEQKKQE